MMKKRNLQILNLWQILTMVVTLIVIETFLLRTIEILNSIVNIAYTKNTNFDYRKLVVQKIAQSEVRECYMNLF